MELAISLNRVGLTDLLNKWKSVSSVEIELLQGKSLVDGIDKTTQSDTGEGGGVVSSSTTVTSGAGARSGSGSKIRPQMTQRSTTGTASFNNSSFNFNKKNETDTSTQDTTSQSSAPLSTATRFLRTFTKGPSGSNLTSTSSSNLTSTSSSMSNAALPGFRRKTTAENASSLLTPPKREGSILDPNGRSGSVLAMAGFGGSGDGSTMVANHHSGMKLEDWAGLLEGLQFLLDSMRDDEDMENIEVEDGNVKAVFDR